MSVDPDRLAGTFTARPERTAGEGGFEEIDIVDGRFSVALLPGTAMEGGLECLIALTGAGEPCGAGG